MFKVGDIVYDSIGETFNGPGKLESMDEVNGSAVIGFFKSPLEPSTSRVKIKLDSLEIAQLYEEQAVFCFDSRTNHWRRARYGGSRPNGDHLVIYRRGDDDVVDLADIHILNLPTGESLNPVNFLKARCNYTPHFSEWRDSFIRSYIEQRASCRSISSIPSSSIELEPHQLAVVRRVLQDENKKYLLADEVGLGKTIEAGLILREQLLTYGSHSIAIVAVPNSLVDQWKSELKERFFLSDLFEKSLFICTHEELCEVLQQHIPSVLVVDEAHQLSSWAWSDSSSYVRKFQQIASAAKDAKTCLLLSGTPLNGNEVNFLAMLHLLAPESYQLSESGISQFRQRVTERERLGGVYQALIPDNDNSTLTDLLDQIIGIFPNDSVLARMIGETRAYVDWLADEEGEERALAIKNLRRYLGENYRLHQRLLRNRREDPLVAQLFPGLDGARISTWPIDSYALSLEQYLDSVRSEYLTSDSGFLAITKENFASWIKAALVSPMEIAARAQNALGHELIQAESEILETLIDFAEREQREKDKTLLSAIHEWQLANPKGRIIIFCGVEKMANHVAEYLGEKLSVQVERHRPRISPAFCTNEEIKILVCDSTGEDGLNLNGGKKLVIHYSLPLSLSRIEQRLGRVNRYSAHIQASPIKSLLLLPDGRSYSYKWQNILTNTVGIFNNTIASLQYVLEEHIDKAWREIPTLGLKSFDFLEEKLTGDKGLIALESQRVKVQEDLNRMEDEVESAIRFSEEVNESDSVAEKYAGMMFDWIIRALKFQRIVGDHEGTFRFKYQTGSSKGARTLLDVETLVTYCSMGMDYEHSDYSSPVTALMSADRKIASRGKQIYPFRYGQPFVDVIYKALRQDVRGICSARFRFVDMKLASPLAFFKIGWLLSKTDPNMTRTNQRVGDEIFTPRLIAHWLNQSGKLVENEKIHSLLKAPYFKRKGNIYQDKNIRPEYWTELGNEFPEDHWHELVTRIVDASGHYLDNELGDDLCFGREIHREIIEASVIVLVGTKS